MKTQINWLLALALLIFAGACQNKATEDSSNSGEALEIDESSTVGSASFAVDSRVSTVDWTGRKIVGDDKHEGKISITEGEFLVKDGQLTGGNFTIDMTSLTVTDLEPGNGKEKLEGHLKTGDFFEVEKFPTAKFDIASVNAVDTISGATHLIAGNLSMRDATKSISFPARVQLLESSIVATTLPFDINRTDWGVNYNSTMIGALKDKAISDDVTISIKIRGQMTEEVQ